MESVHQTHNTKQPGHLDTEVGPFYVSGTSPFGCERGDGMGESACAPTRWDSRAKGMDTYDSPSLYYRSIAIFKVAKPFRYPRFPATPNEISGFSSSRILGSLGRVWAGGSAL